MSDNTNGDGGTPNVPTAEELQAQADTLKVELEKAHKAKERAENKARELDMENSKLREGGGAPLTKEDVKGVVREVRQEERLDEALTRTTADPSEQAELKRIISEELRPTGNISYDIERAKAIKDYHKNRVETDEAKRALLARQRAGQGDGSGGRKVDTPKLTESEQKYKEAFPEMSDEKIIAMRK